MATFQEMKARYEAPDERGFIGRVLGGMTQPFRRALEAAQYAASSPGTYKPIFKSSSEEDINAAITKPSEQVLKSVASGASYLIPGGGGAATTVLGGIGRAAAKGTAAGLLSGYGLSETGKEFESALSGGAIGGILGGGLQAGGELFRRLGQRAPKGGVGVEKIKGSAAKLNMSPEEFTDDVSSLLEDMSGRRYDVSSSKSLANNFKSYLSEIGEEVDDFASVAQGAPDTQGIRKLYTENLKYIDNSSAGQKFKDITDDLLAKPNPTYGDLVEYTRKLDKVGGGFKRVMKDSSSQLGQTLKDIREVAREATSTNPQLSTALETYSKAKNLQSTILKNPEIANNVFLGGILPFSKSVNIRPITEKVSGLGNKLYNATIPSQRTVGAVEKMVGLGQRTVPALTAIGAAREKGSQGEQGLGGLPLGGIGMGQQSQQLSVQDALSLAQQIMPTASESEIMSLAKMLMTESAPPEITAASISAQGALADIGKMVSIISEGGGVPFASALPFGAFNEKAQVYKNAARNVYDLVTRTRTGAALNQSEEEFYKQFVPGITDTEASTRDKIQRLQSLYTALAGEISSGTYFPQQQISSDYGF